MLSLETLEQLRRLAPSRQAAIDACEKLASFGKCVRPILFKATDPEHPFFCGGTCFVAKYESNIIAFTAQHCLLNENRIDEPVIISVRPDLNLPIRQEVHLERHQGSNLDDTTWSDVSCLPTFDSARLHELNGDEFLDLTRLPNRSLEINSGRLLCVVGWPHQTTVYDSHAISRSEAVLFGSYDGPSESKHCHLLTRLVSSCDDPNGLSGSPVVALSFSDGELAECELAGMVLQAGGNPLTMRFVEIGVILRMAAEVARVLTKRVC